MDTVDKATRSRIMASVGQRDTGPEIRLRKTLHHLGFRYRLNVRKLPGSPDLVFRGYNAVIFVNGCFWHRHGCRYSTFPTTRKKFWQDKFEANKERDKRNIEILIKKGWRVLIVWECTLKLKKGKEFKRLIDLVAKWIRSDNPYKEL